MKILEREVELAELRGVIRQAARGHGGGIAVVGESGAGKSVVVAQALDTVDVDVRILWGHCDPLPTPRALGPFRESKLASVDSAAAAGAVRVSDLCDRVRGELSTRPTVLVIEDLHWLDEVSGELLRFLARRIESMPLALIVTYRDVEIGARHPARPLLGDFASLDGLQTLKLRPLSVDAIKELVCGTSLDPGRVHAVTGGNPFFVTAVAREPELPMPGSVRDAVLARVAEIAPEDLEVLQLVATAPDGLDDRALPALAVGLPTLRRLDDTSLLTRTRSGVAFRHELARLALLSTIPPGGSAVFHTRLLDVLERLEPRDPAVLTHHAVGARDVRRSVLHARAAAAEAVASSSNIEAAAFLEIALTNLPATAPPAERAGLFAQLARQQYLTGQVASAITSAHACIPLWEAAGDLAGVAEAHAALSILEYISGSRRNCEVHARMACEIADRSGVPATIARAYADAATMAAIGSDLDRARDLAARTLAVATVSRLDELVVAGHLLGEAPSCLTGDTAARARMLSWTAAARHGGWDELAWRGYVLLFAADLEQGNLREAGHLIDDAMIYVTDRELPIAQHWHRSFRALLHLRAARWSAAREDAERVVADVVFGSMWPEYVLGLVNLRHAQQDSAPFLDGMWEKACGLDEPLRYLPALCALAEAMWMTGVPDERVTDYAVANLAALTATPDTGWSAGALVIWLRRLGLDVAVPATVAEPYRSQLAGRHEDAAAWWRAAGDPFAEALAYVDSPEPHHRVTAVTLLDKAGAIGTADRLRVELRHDGLAAVPQRPRESTRTNPGGLTNRQFDVARLVAQGLSNSEIAAQLYISPKTTDHHVSAILTKLGVPSRRAVVTRAHEFGLD